MNLDAARKVANTILYEGFMLYPYRPSALKNRQRWTFGILYPPSFDEVVRGTERSTMHSECLLASDSPASVRIEHRFLHLGSRQLAQINKEGTKPVPSLFVDGRLIDPWDEAVERSTAFDVKMETNSSTFDFSFDGSTSTEPVHDHAGRFIGIITGTQHEIRETITVRTEQVQNALWKIAIDVHNKSSLTADPHDREAALLCSLVSAHTILTASDGAQFVSLLAPPDNLRPAAAACRNVGNFPVLLGSEGERDMLLCSPILLYDYPQIAPESAGDFFDATEMDEMLTLRLMTLTEEEKTQMRSAGERSRQLLERTEQTAREQLMRIHGTIRNLRPVSDK